MRMKKKRSKMYHRFRELLQHCQKKTEDVAAVAG